MAKFSKLLAHLTRITDLELEIAENENFEGDIEIASKHNANKCDIIAVVGGMCTLPPFPACVRAASVFWLRFFLRFRSTHRGKKHRGAPRSLIERGHFFSSRCRPVVD